MRGSGIPRSLIAASLVVVVACSGPTASSTPPPSDAAGLATPSPAPVDTLVPTVAPTAIPTPTAAPTTEPSSASPDVFQPTGLLYANQFVMRIAVSDLNVRAKPTTKAVSSGKARKGALYLVYDWPIKADGRTWYYGYELLTPTFGVLPDLPRPLLDGYDGVLTGWMAAGTTDAPFLVPVAPRCPANQNVENVAAMLAYERINCFGADQITVQGTFGCDFCDGETEGVFEPAWLAGTLDFDLLHDGDFTMALRLAPDGPPRPADGATIRVHGHYLDPRSSSCTITLDDQAGNPTLKVDAGIAKQLCQGGFVVDSIEVVS